LTQKSNVEIEDLHMH